jgi:hypothetical protein
MVGCLPHYLGTPRTMSTSLTLKESSALAVPFLVGVGACHSFGFWGYFKIDVLQFVGLSDLAKLAVYPLLFLAVSTLITMALTEVALGPVFAPGGGNQTAVGRFGFKYWRILVAGDLALLVAVVLLVPEPNKWYLICMFLPILSTPLTHVQSIIELIPNPRVRAVVLLHVLLLPCLSFAYGRVTAISLASGDAPLYVDVERSGLPLRSDLSAPVIYLGKLGETYVFLERKTGWIALVKPKDDVPLILRREGG